MILKVINLMALEARKQYLALIRNSLTKLLDEVKISTPSNLLDINIYAEKFYIDFLNILYRYELTSTNQFCSNFAGIDAVDDRKKIIVQITSQITKRKITSTLKKDNLKVYEGYNLFFMMITDDSKKLKKAKYEVPKNLNFNPENNILDNTSLFEKCVYSDIDLIQELAEYCKKQDEANTTPLVKSSGLAQVVKAISRLDITLDDKPTVRIPFSIQDKIDFNKLTDIQASHISKVSFYSFALDGIYSELAKEGIDSKFIFQKIVTLFKEEQLSRVKKSNSQIFLDLACDLTDYISKSDNLGSSMLQEKIEYYCQIIVTDAFMRCKIFENPEENNDDSTN